MAGKGTPPCKPLRLTEWFAMIICFTFLFFTRRYTEDQISILTSSELIFCFITFGSLMFLTGGDVFSQLIKDPTTNSPMIFLCLVATILCCTCGFTLVISHEMHAQCRDAKRVLSAVSLLIAGSFFSSVIYLIDAIILIRFA